MMIYVINLNRSTGRRTNIIHQFDSLGVKPTFFNAVDGNAEDHYLFGKYDANLRIRLKGKPLTRGQLGCFASHYLLWEKCVQNSKPMIVLEDDALIDKELFLSFLKSIKLLDKKHECIRLFENHDKRHKTLHVKEINGISIAKFTKGHKRSTGYYLTPSGAKKFLKSADTWFLTLDIYMDRFWDHGVECFGTLPACLTNDPKFESTIDYGNINKKKRRLLVKVKREIFSTCEWLLRSFHNIKFKINN